MRPVTSARTKTSMRPLKLSRAFTLIEPGPVVLVTTRDRDKSNVMTVSWTSVLDFTPQFTLTTGAWNHSYQTLRKTKECVLAIPAVDQLDLVIAIGTCSGSDTDKFAKFGIATSPAQIVKAPLLADCLANIECKVIDIVTRHNIVVLEAVAACTNPRRKEKRTLHAVGDGTFIADGVKFNRRKQMASKLPSGI